MKLTAVETAYSVAFVISVLYLLSLAIVKAKHNIYHLCAALLVVCENAGAMTIAFANCVETARLGNRITYIASCFLPLALFIAWSRMCGYRMLDMTKIFLASLSGIVLIMAWFQDKYHFFYKNIIFVIRGRNVNFSWSNGPGYYVYIALLIGYAVLIVHIGIYALRTEVHFSYHTIVSFLGICLCFAVGYILHNFLRKNNIEFDPIPLGYTASLVFYNELFTKMGLYNTNISVLKAEGRSSLNGYIVFDNNQRLTAYNQLACELFPELDDIPIDSAAKAYLDKSLYEIIFRPLFELGKSFTENFESGEKKFIGNLKEIVEESSQKCKGYIVEIVDATYSSKTKEIMETSRTRLKSDVESNIKHIEEIRRGITSGMASMIESRDRSTGGHITRTSDVIRIFSDKLEETGYCTDKVFLHNVEIAAPMHDLGKITVDDAVLRKQGKYTPEEFEMMKKHSTEGARIVRKVLGGYDDSSLIEVAVNVAHYHHEKWNGNGYPDGLRENEIPLEARIMALADVFDALVSKRCYKEPYTFDEAFRIIEESSGSHFDPKLTAIFIQCRPELESLYESNKNQ